MKSLLLFIALLSALTLSSSLSTSATSAANAPRKERALTKFNQPVQLMDKTLSGEYLFVHDDAAMARGDACTYIYKGQTENLNNLVVSFHCFPAQRAKAAYFSVRSVMTLVGTREISEFQFAGSTEAHVVPSSPHSAHIAITN